MSSLASASLVTMSVAVSSSPSRRCVTDPATAPKMGTALRVSMDLSRKRVRTSRRVERMSWKTIASEKEQRMERMTGAEEV